MAIKGEREELLANHRIIVTGNAQPPPAGGQLVFGSMTDDNGSGGAPSPSPQQERPQVARPHCSSSSVAGRCKTSWNRAMAPFEDAAIECEKAQSQLCLIKW